MKLSFDMYVIKDIKYSDKLPTYYKISDSTDGNIWISNQDGEGGQFEASHFYEAIDKFFKENY